MGLDMYAFTTAETVAAAVDFTTETATELAYWRKHPNLHGWMERLYRAKGGTDADFNCVNVALDADDLDRLERDIRKHPPRAVWRLVVVIVYRVSLWTHTRTPPAFKFCRFLTRAVAAVGRMMRRSGSLKKAIATA